ncbi:MAG: hypothetical protein WD468_11590 [Pirellulales bacterium]
MKFGTDSLEVLTLCSGRLMARRFSLRSLFTLTGFAALFAFGVSAARYDLQLGGEIALFAVGMTLAWLFFEIPAAFWVGISAGFVVGAVWYWWNDVYYEVVPADRLFEFVITTIWCSIAGGLLSFPAWALLRRAGRFKSYLLSRFAKNSDGST